MAFGFAAVGCASPSGQGGTPAPPGSAPPTTLVMVVNTEVSNLWPKAIGPTSPGRTTRIFNADLTLIDAQDNVHPYLAESLPQLNTDAWQVFPDGRMETTWKLRPGLTWQDGQPLTAEDFAFAFRVYTAPDLASFFGPKPQDIIERLIAVDPQTIRVFWRSSFLHTGTDLEPLPRALLSEPFAAFERDPAGQRDAFMSQRFWTTEYVGAGPYRLTAWEPASQLAGAAFDGHALGRPKIDRVVIRIINNENTALANMMAGEVHMTMTQAIRFEQAMILRRQGGFNDVEGKGKLLFKPTSTTSALVQFRPEYQQTPALLDLRVRKAIASAIDKDALSEGLFEGQVPVPISHIAPDVSYYAEIDRAITKYPYEPRTTEQLMNEAGYSRGRDGVFVDSTGQRFQPDFWSPAGDQQQRALAIVLNTWQGVGIDAQPLVMPAALERDNQARSTFPGIAIQGVALNETTPPSQLISREIASPANRWNGNNRAGWSNPSFDLLWERYNSTLDLAEQVQAYVQMMKLHSEQLPNFPLHYSVNVVSHLAVLRGPDGASTHWNIYEWELTS